MLRTYLALSAETVKCVLQEQKKPLDSELVTRRFGDKNALSQSIIVQELENAVKGESKDDMQDVARLLCLLLCVSLFFGTRGTRQSWAFVKYIEDLKNIKKYNWASQIANNLISSVHSNYKEPDKSTGCLIALQYWLCEKTKICPLEKPYESPAFVKWNLHVLEKKLQSFNLGSLNQNHIKTEDEEETEIKMKRKRKAEDEEIDEEEERRALKKKGKRKLVQEDSEEEQEGEETEKSEDDDSDEMHGSGNSSDEEDVGDDGSDEEHGGDDSSDEDNGNNNSSDEENRGDDSSDEDDGNNESGSASMEGGERENKNSGSDGGESDMEDSNDTDNDEWGVKLKDFSKKEKSPEREKAAEDDDDIENWGGEIPSSIPSFNLHIGSQVSVGDKEDEIEYHNKKLQKDVDELEKSKHQLEEQQLCLLQENEEMKVTVIELKAEREKMMTEMAELKDENQHLQDQVLIITKEAQQNQKKMMTEMAELKDKNQHLQDQVVIIIKEAQQNQKNKRELETENMKLKGQTFVQKVETPVVTEVLTQAILQDKLDKKKKIIEEKNKIIENLTKAGEKLVKENNDLKVEILQLDKLSFGEDVLGEVDVMKRKENKETMVDPSSLVLHVKNRERKDNKDEIYSYYTGEQTEELKVQEEEGKQKLKMEGTKDKLVVDADAFKTPLPKLERKLDFTLVSEWPVLDYINNEDKQLMKAMEGYEGTNTLVWIGEKPFSSVYLKDIFEIIHEDQLQSNVIDSYAEILMISQKNNVKLSQTERSYIFPSTCMSLINDEEHNSANIVIKESVKNALLKVYRFVHFPIHTKVEGGTDHWTLMVLDKHEAKWSHYNSMQQRNKAKDRFWKDAVQMKAYFEKICKGKKGKLEAVECPQQQGSYDCGIVICYVMKQVANQEQLSTNFTLDYWQQMRAEIISTLLNDWPRSWTEAAYLETLNLPKGTPEKEKANTQMKIRIKLNQN